MLFKTSLDKTAIIITIFFTVLFAFLIVLLYSIDLPGNNALPPVYIAILLLLLYTLAFAFHPSAYKISGDTLFICRPAGDVRIQRKDIKSAAVISKKELRNAIRTFGVGGLFGYYGCYANYTLGSMTWYATRKDKAVLITTTNNKKILVTPNDPAAFIAALHA